jgi:DNA-binding NarL/FixJ family response regulator
MTQMTQTQIETAKILQFMESKNRATTRPRVVKLFKKGLSKQAIATKLGISKFAVHYHVRNARKFGELP